MSISYKDAGVDVEKGDEFVRRIKAKVASTHGPEVVTGIGGFAALYDQGDRYLVSGTDGVGTKIKLAQKLDQHSTVGIDLVAMCVNDILCTGARPLFFLDYIASGELDLQVNQQLIEGIVEGCKQSGCSLIGGETAEMPGVYADGEYDLAGFAVGEVSKDKLVDGSKLQKGDVLLGLGSSGLHSNGFSLVRRLIADDETELMQKCLTPTRLYVKNVLEVLKQHPRVIRAMAHITGGGIENIVRMHPKFDYHLVGWPKTSHIPEALTVVARRSGLGREELLKTFNMGIGMVLAVKSDASEAIQQSFESLGERVWVLGEVGKGNGKLHLGEFSLL